MLLNQLRIGYDRFGKDEQKWITVLQNAVVYFGDKIFGFITINDGIKVHNENCPNAINLRANYDYRVLTAKWVNAERFTNRAKIEIEGLDRQGMIMTSLQLFPII